MSQDEGNEPFCYFHNNTATAFLEEGCPTNRRATQKGTLLNLIPMDLIFGLSYLNIGSNLKYLMPQINSLCNPFLCMATYQYWDQFLEFRNFLLCHMIKYEWSDRHYVKTPCLWVPNCLTNND